ncbi:MAG TPA: 5'-3' exonuclease H3TH domain-containing protein [Steroidobacteraceae bacterium]|nr:5'-3' exonuclease H3TH domain-containing protein [Steroidobacteraceae bacterium]
MPRGPREHAHLIFLVDASVYVFRAYHSILPDMRDRDGNPVHAVFGFARFLGDLIERVRPRYLAVAFDQRRTGSYRSRIYPPYKANRERTPADLVLQLECCRELCRHLGLAVFVDPEYEADDIIGTLATGMRGEGVPSAFITRDKDLAQLMRDGDLFWDFGARGQFGYHDIERHFGVLPECFADYLALTGDEVDNIPGVPGVGHRTAASLMKAFGSLDALYGDLARVARLKLRGAASLPARLAEHRESVFLARRLTRIACDLSLGVASDGLRRRAPNLPALAELYDRLGFGPFLRRQGERLAHLPAA